MEIKINNIIRRLILFDIVIIVFLASFLMIATIDIAYAEPYVRVCKNGVVYYYFANKMDKKNSDSTRINKKGRIPPPRVQNKLVVMDIEPWIKSATQQHNITESLFKAVIRVESNFNPAATSPKGAQGLRQLMPGTAEQLQVSNPYDIKENIEPSIKSASQQHNIPESLIKAVIRVESNFNPAATSPKGAQGLMQLMPGTAEQLQVSNPYDIKENILGGTHYLGMLLQRFDNNLPMALAAYNAGPRRVQQYQGIPPIKETQGFVKDVCVTFLQYSGKSPRVSDK